MLNMNGHCGLFALPTVNLSTLTWFWSKFFQHVWSTSSSMGWSEKDAWAKTSFVAALRVTAKFAFSLQWEIEKNPFITVNQTSRSNKLFLISLHYNESTVKYTVRKKLNGKKKLSLGCYLFKRHTFVPYLSLKGAF